MTLRNNKNPDESDHSSGPSDSLISLLLEIDSAFHEQRTLQLDEGLMNNLSQEEQARLQRAQERLQLLYSQANPKDPQSGEQNRMPSTVIQGDHEQDDIHSIPDLDSFFRVSGSKFGHFEILRGLGMGGHGVVFLARDSVLDRLVALKVPRPDVLIHPTMRRRFLAEGRTAALLLHPNIVTVFESGEVGAVCYLAQDYVAGPSLADWLLEHLQPVAPKIAAALILQLVDAVALAHRHHILHRDIKPGNILLAPLPSFDGTETLDHYLPKLADFGMAKLLQNQTQTNTGTVLGTPAYMPPEQAMGRHELMGAASDIYSMGAVLFELLTHRPLYQGSSEVETLHQVLHSEPPYPHEFVPEVPRDLEAICMKCLRRVPQERYGTAQKLAEDLRRYLDGRPVLARPQSSWSIVCHWSQRNPAMATLSTTSLIATLSLVAGLLWFNARLNHSLQTVQRHESELQVQTLALRRRIYADDLNLASKAWANSDMAQVRKRLEPYFPRNQLPDFRTFPWWLLWRISQENAQTLGCHPGGATAVAINDSGTLGASAGIDGLIRLWSLPEGQLAGILRGHDAKDINSLHFAPGDAGQRLVSASDDGTVRVWNTRSLTQELILNGHYGWVAVARFLGAGGESIATGAQDHLIRIWDAKTGELSSTMTGHTDTVRDLREDPHSQRLASTSEDGTIRLWDWKNGTTDSRLPDGKLETPVGTWARILAFSPNKAVLAAGFRNGELIEWDLRSFRFGQIRRKTEITTSIRTLDWRDDNSLLVGTDACILFCRAAAENGYSWESLRGHSEKVMAAQSSGPKGGCLSADQGGRVCWWPSKSLDGDLPVHSPVGGPTPLLQWNGSLIATSVHPEEIQGFRLPDMSPVFQIKVPNRSTRNWFCSRSDGKTLMLFEDLPEGNYVTCYETDSQAIRWRLPLQDFRLHSFQLTPDERHVALCLESEVWLIDWNRGDKRLTLRHPNDVRMVKFNRDDSTLTTACADGKIRTWHVNSGNLMHSHQAHHDAVTHISFSLNGNLLASSGEDRKARVWRLSDWAEIASYSLPDLAVGLELMDEGATLATVCRTTFIVWSVPDQVQLMQSDEIYRKDNFIQFSPDRKSIAVQDRQHIRLFHGAP